MKKETFTGEEKKKAENPHSTVRSEVWGSTKVDNDQ